MVLGRERAALEEDCLAATVVISWVPVRRRACSAPVAVIDLFKLWREVPTPSGWMRAGCGLEVSANSAGDAPGPLTGVATVTENASIFADQRRQPALNGDPVGTENPRFMGRVGRLQRDGVALAAKTLQGHLGFLHQSHHDGAIFG